MFNTTIVSLMTSYGDIILHMTDTDVFKIYTAFYAAQSSARSDLIFNPRPPNHQRILNEINKHDVQTNIDRILSGEEKSPLIQAFVIWIITNNPIRTESARLSFEEKDVTINITEHTIINSYIRERQFEKMKGFNSTVFLFHGSALENFHSITINGLKNCSGTKLMKHGAAYGSGVYLTSNFQLCSTYGINTTGKKDVPMCIAVCDVIIEEGDRKGNGIFVIPDEERILIRYILFVTFDYENKNVNKMYCTDYRKLEDQLYKRFAERQLLFDSIIERNLATRRRRLDKELNNILIYDIVESITQYDTITWRIDSMNYTGVPPLLIFKYDYPISSPVIFDANGVHKVKDYRPTMSIAEIIITLVVPFGQQPQLSIEKILSDADNC